MGSQRLKPAVHILVVSFRFLVVKKFDPYPPDLSRSPVSRNKKTKLSACFCRVLRGEIRGPLGRLLHRHREAADEVVPPGNPSAQESQGGVAPFFELGGVARFFGVEEEAKSQKH